MRRSPLRRKTPLTSTQPLERHTRIRPVSPRRRREQREYTRLRAAYLEGHPRCEFPGGCIAPATEIHHKRGRTGSLYIDVDWWTGLCHAHHAWATVHPVQAKEIGVSANRVGAP